VCVCVCVFHISLPGGRTQSDIIRSVIPIARTTAFKPIGNRSQNRQINVGPMTASAVWLASRQESARMTYGSRDVIAAKKDDPHVRPSARPSVFPSIHPYIDYIRAVGGDTVKASPMSSRSRDRLS
ncbi:hypothetical protein LSH36_196g07041, partial [Paralvinella palmiformis]